jgi:hypothetical protein
MKAPRCILSDLDASRVISYLAHIHEGWNQSLRGGCDSQMNKFVRGSNEFI